MGKFSSSLISGCTHEFSDNMDAPTYTDLATRFFPMTRSQDWDKLSRHQNALLTSSNNRRDGPSAMLLGDGILEYQVKALLVAS